MSIDPVHGMGSGAVPSIHGADSVHQQHLALHQQAHDAAVHHAHHGSPRARPHVHACADPACTQAGSDRTVRSLGVAIGFGVFFCVVLALIVGIGVTAVTSDPVGGAPTACSAVDGREIPCPRLP